MGLFDEVWFDEELPALQSSCRRFQTKSLDNCMDRYVVTKEGRLCMVGNLFTKEPPVAVVPEGNVDTDFHGDIRLISDDGKHEEYVARFTHGTLEWIRPMADVPRLIGRY